MADGTGGQQQIILVSKICGFKDKDSCMHVLLYTTKSRNMESCIVSKHHQKSGYMLSTDDVAVCL